MFLLEGCCSTPLTTSCCSAESVTEPAPLPEVDSAAIMPKLNVEAVFEGRSSTVTYVAWCDETREAAVIDSVMGFDAPSGKTCNSHSEKVYALIQERRLDVKYIIETHVHADHLTGAQFFKARFPEARSCIGERVTEIQETFATVFNFKDFATDGSQFDLLLRDGQELALGGVRGSVLHTPGHTPACVCVVLGDAVFTGDTIFMPDMGSARCDFPGGSAAALYDSVHKIYNLPAATRVFVGHDYAPGGREHRWETTVADEKASNKSLKDDTSLDAFVSFRKERDATLGAPALLLPSLQVNLANGKMPEPEDNGTRYLKIPVDAL